MKNTYLFIQPVSSFLKVEQTPTTSPGQQKVTKYPHDVSYISLQWAWHYTMLAFHLSFLFLLLTAEQNKKRVDFPI